MKRATAIGLGLQASCAHKVNEGIEFPVAAHHIVAEREAWGLEQARNPELLRLTGSSPIRGRS